MIGQLWSYLTYRSQEAKRFERLERQRERKACKQKCCVKGKCKPRGKNEKSL